MDEEKLEAGSGGWVGEGEGDFVQAGLGEGSLEGYGGGLPMEGSVAMDGAPDMNYGGVNEEGGFGEESRPETGFGFGDEEEVKLPGVDDLPLFANPDARKIDLDIKAKEEDIELKVDEIEDMKERVKVMKEHFKNVQQELEHTNSLFNAKQAEIHTEEHLKQLTSRALGRSQLDSKKAQMSLEEVQDQLSSTQSAIYKANEKMDEFKMQMNWNQEKLEQWAVAAKQKEEDNIALQKYTRADELKIKELSMQLEQLTKECVIQKSGLENEVTETQAQQMQLDRIAVEFEQSHVERKNLVLRWQETVNETQRRDEQIVEASEGFGVAKKARAKKEFLLNTQQKRLIAQQGENQEVEAKSEMLGRIMSRKREEMMIGQKKVADFRDELESLKNELTTAAESLVTKRSTNTNGAAVNEERKVALEWERQKYQVANEKLNDAKKSTRTAEQEAQLAEVALRDGEKEWNLAIDRVKVLKEGLLKESQAVFELKREETRLTGEVAGSKSTSKNLEGQLGQLDREAARQQELLYSAEFQIQQIERKIARGMGERSDEEKRALKALIEGAEERLEKSREKRKMLTGQLRKLQNELVTYRSRREALAKKKHDLTEKQGELELQSRMIEDELKKQTRIKEEEVVANDLMRLEVRRLKDLLSAKADAVFSLENRRQQLLLSMEERKQEVAVHRDVLKAEHRTSNEEKHKAVMDLREREHTVEKLKSRFEAVARGEDEGHSQSYYIIKAAQKREEMQRRGDELNQDVIRCEREIRALQTTLDHLKARNNAFRNSFQKVDVQGTDVEVLKQLEERTKLAKDALFKKKKEMQRLVTDFEEDSRRLEQVKSQANRVETQRMHLESAKSQVEEELLIQDVQLSELTDRCEKLVEKHRGKTCEKLNLAADAFDQGSGTLEEKSAKAEVLKDVVQNVLYTLSQLAAEFPEVSDELNRRVLEASLRIPSKPPAKNVPAASTMRPSTSESENQNNGQAGARQAVPQQTFSVEGI